MDKHSYIANAHGSAIDELYSAYKKDPASVDQGWQKFFEGFEFSLQYGDGVPEIHRINRQMKRQIRQKGCRKRKTPSNPVIQWGVQLPLTSL